MLRVQGLKKYFGQRDRPVRAVDDVSFEIAPGEVLGMVGESGSGKSTIGRSLLKLIEPSAGAILHNGVDPLAMKRQQFLSHRRDYQIIFQDPNAALNPRMTILSSVLEPLELARAGSKAERLMIFRTSLIAVWYSSDF